MKKRIYKKFDIVELIFRDPTSHYGWRTDGDRLIEHAILCKTIGYLVKITKRNYILCSLRHSTGENFADVFTVPIGCIEKCRRIKQ